MTGSSSGDRIDPEFLPAGPLPPTALSTSNLMASRASLDSRRSAAAAALVAPVRIEDHTVPTQGRDIPIRLYRGSTLEASPTVIYCHSGGYVLGNLDTDQARCIDIARLAGCLLVSIEYRLAPEHPYPAALDDCYAILLSALDGSLAQLGVDETQVAIAGNSAGAGLAAALALRARDAKAPVVRAQILHQPMLDRRCATASMQEFSEAPYFDTVSAVNAWAMYVGAGDSSAAYLSPGETYDLGQLPTTYIACSEIDPLRDEAIDYAVRLIAAGVPTELHVFPATCHGFDSIAPDAEASRQAIAEQAAALRRAWT